MLGVPAAEFSKYTVQAKEELGKLRGLLSASQEEQARQADVLEAVNDAVRNSGAALESLDLKSTDIAAELRRNAASNEATARSIMSVQYFLAAVAQGTVTDREQALAMLQQSFQDQAATLPSVQEQSAHPHPARCMTAHKLLSCPPGLFTPCTRSQTRARRGAAERAFRLLVKLHAFPTSLPWTAGRPLHVRCPMCRSGIAHAQLTCPAL